MTRATAIALAAFSIACSNDTFVSGGDGGASDASEGGQPSDAAPPPDAITPGDGSTEAGCATKAGLPCSGPCTTAETCCVTSSASNCTLATCVGGEAFACTSSKDCTNGQVCCLLGMEGITSCPPTAESSGDSLTTQCTSTCAGKRVCDVDANDCGGAGTCATVHLDVNPAYGLGLCL